ncbi:MULTISPECIES: hypothetical protein [unclassified Crossiella]|uniref:hypothetical protein n=1 Tax=unclassified Crossiella TaxID=2620835 RepID=UPI001FFFD47B|nr:MULTISPECIES: hypothetical protein [unclassified Crossiella]MCK2240943.1 hypothetical protein [Crossiella sp. S99.2]MCK2253913.1 hypothetical protein [Crossiella sp. S99.1]
MPDHESYHRREATRYGTKTGFVVSGLGAVAALVPTLVLHPGPWDAMTLLAAAGIGGAVTTAATAAAFANSGPVPSRPPIVQPRIAAAVVGQFAVVLTVLSSCLIRNL